MINILRSAAITVTPIVLDLYDKEETASLLPLIAQPVSQPDDPTVGLVKLEWWHAFPQLRLWVADRKTQKLFAESMEIPIKKYEITLSLDRDRLGNTAALVNDAARLGQPVAKGFSVGKTILAAKVLGDNPIAYDGQDFFDTDHAHPGGAAYSNLLSRGTDTPARTTDGAPTMAEAAVELRAHKRRLLQNTIVRNNIISTRTIDKSIVVVVRDDETEDAYESLRTEDDLASGVKNIMKGTFEVLREFGSSAPALSYDVINALPGGPRPVVFVAVKEPSGLQFDASQEFRNAKIDFGSDGRYGVHPGFPQTAIRSIAP
jgi:hypothetical protein